MEEKQAHILMKIQGEINRIFHVNKIADKTTIIQTNAINSSQSKVVSAP